MGTQTKRKLGSGTQDSLPDSHVQFNAIKKYFEGRDIHNAVSRAVERTRQWLQTGKQSYGADGTLQIRKPWWPSDLRETDNSTLMEERPQIYRDRVFEHGLLRLFHTLDEEDQWVLGHNFYFGSESNVRDIDRWSLIVECVTDPGTKPVIRHLAARKAGDLMPLSQKKMANMYRYSPNAPHKVQTKLKKLAPIGLIQVRAKGGLAVENGVIGQTFYDDIYLPFVSAYDRGHGRVVG